MDVTVNADRRRLTTQQMSELGACHRACFLAALKEECQACTDGLAKRKMLPSVLAHWSRHDVKTARLRKMRISLPRALSEKEVPF